MSQIETENWPSCPECGAVGVQDRLVGNGNTRFSCSRCPQTWTELKGWSRTSCEACEISGNIGYCENCSHYQSGDNDGYADMIDEANRSLIEALATLRAVHMEPDEIETFFLEFLEEY